MPDRPEPPDVPQYLIDGLDRQHPEKLQAIASYADSLAAWRINDEEPEAENESEQSSMVEESKIPPDAVPSKATIVTKEINGNRYKYWQWRDGEHVRSKYEGPVVGSE